MAMTRLLRTAGLLLLGGSLVALAPQDVHAGSGVCDNADDACQIYCDGTFYDYPQDHDRCILTCLIQYLECLYTLPEELW
jgi:hypothetical protein